MKEAKTRCKKCNQLIMPNTPRYRTEDGSCYHDSVIKRCRPDSLDNIKDAVEDTETVAAKADPDAEDVDSIVEKVGSDAEDVDSDAEPGGEIDVKDVDLDASAVDTDVQNADPDVQNADPNVENVDAGDVTDTKLDDQAVDTEIEVDPVNVEGKIKMIPIRLRRDEFRFILVRGGDKRPIEEKWTTTANYTYDDPLLQKHLRAGGNYGVVGGFGNLVPVDVDIPAIREKVEKELPATFTVQTCSGNYHKYFIIPDLTAPIRLYDKNNKPVADVQGAGKQVVGPSCVAKNKQGTMGTYRVVENLAIATITEEQLKKVLEPWLVKTRAKEKYPKKDWTPLDTLSITDVVSLTKLTNRGIQYQGAHPVHGSTGGQNFSVNVQKNVWHCFRHSSGGGPLEWLAVDKGLIDCAEALPGCLQGDKFWEILEIAEKNVPGFKRADIVGKTDKNTGKKPVTQWLEEQRATRREENYQLACELMNEYQFLTTKDSEELWVYLDGLWRPEGTPVIKASVESAFQDEATVNRAKEVIGHIKRSTLTDRKIFNSRDNLINVGNGAIDFSHNPPEFIEHRPDHYFTYKLPVSYDPQARCPNIEQFLSDILDEIDVEFWIEWIGYHLCPEYPFHKFVIGFGTGRNGKSVLKSLMEAFLGKENVANISIQALNEDKFMVAQLHGKLGNLCGDLPKKLVRYTGVLKQLTGGDRLVAQHKRQHPFFFENTAKLTFFANELPPIEEDTLALWERLEVIPFLREFLEDDPEREVHILKSLTTPKELSGLLNLALEGLGRMLERGGISHTTATAEKREYYIRASSTEQAFFEQCVGIHGDEEILKGKFYDYYCAYCRKFGYSPSAPGSLTKKLNWWVPKEGGKVEKIRGYAPGSRTERPWIWKGIFMRCDEDDEEGRPRCKDKCFEEEKVKQTSIEISE
ncbi:MAG: hypothetical protein E3J35_04240 [Methanomassiliicoccales archaeon]|nr:MAG: hypothetical protein E3J35_04240 [Methanomassiliicoccales archaeon]